MSNIRENSKVLLERKQKLENDLTTLMVKFYEDTGIWPENIKVFRDVYRDIGNIGDIEGVTVDCFVKVRLEI